MFEDFILEDVDDIDEIDDNSSNDDIDTDDDNDSYALSYIEDEIPDILTDSDNLNFDTDENATNSNEDQHSKNSSVSFTGHLHCLVKGCKCGGYVSPDSGNVCANCKHTYAQHR